MSKKKICFISQFPPPIHGLSKAVDTLYNSWLNKEFDFEKIDIKNNKRFLLSIISILKSKADLFYFTISQSKGGNLRDLIILKLLELRKKKCLIHLHGGYYRQLIDNDISKWQRKRNYKAISKLAGVIVLGESLKPIFEGMIDEEKIHIVPNCVDDEYLMSDEDFEKKISTLEERKIKHILYLSNFIRSKGYPELLKMACLEKKRVESGEERKFHFDFAGKFFEKTEEDFFFKYVNKHELNEYVTYHGVVSGDKKRELLKKCDIFALLTRYPNEGQPISILEAMGNGMVILTTNHAGIPDIVEDGVNGVVFDKRDINYSNIYERINGLVNLCELEQNNRRTVKDLYKEINYINSMNTSFENVLM